jgi:hypothetical protein
MSSDLKYTIPGEQWSHNIATGGAVVLNVTDGMENICADPGEMEAASEVGGGKGPGLPGGGKGGQLASDSGGG